MLNIMGLKSRNMISLPLDIPNVDVRSVEMNKRGDYIITVKSTRWGKRHGQQATPTGARYSSVLTDPNDQRKYDTKDR